MKTKIKMKQGIEKKFLAFWKLLLTKQPDTRTGEDKNSHLSFFTFRMYLCQTPPNYFNDMENYHSVAIRD